MITRNNTKTLTGAKIIIEALKNLGIDTIFGYPGGIVLDLYDELYKQTSIKHILVRHEQAAVHAAEGYARVSGKCGVVLVTSGPGATNTVTGITNAYLDGYPLIVLTGQVSSNLLGKDAFQEANICEITKSCTKKTYQITKAEDIQNTIIKAYNTAMSGKKGPVVIDLTKNIFSENADYNETIKYETNKSSTFYIDTNNICSLIKKSQHPLIIVGGGVNHSQSDQELFDFIKKTKIPFVSTMMGLGTFNPADINYFGMLGIFGNNSANGILKKSDLIISLGARLNDRITCKFNKDKDLDNKIIQVDINPDEKAKNYIPLEFVNSDIKLFLKNLNENFNNFVNFQNWSDMAQILKRNNKKPEKYTNLRHSYEVIKALESNTKDKDIIFTSEVGQHQLWAIQNLNITPERKILLSGGAGTMGFGLPAAIGACIAHPSKTVVCIAGDGSLQMTLGELALCKDYNLNLKIIVLNNGYLGMVRQLQENSCNARYSETKISNPDFTLLAKAYGIQALSVKSSSDINKALCEAFSHKGSFLLDIEVEPMEIVK